MIDGIYTVSETCQLRTTRYIFKKMCFPKIRWQLERFLSELPLQQNFRVKFSLKVNSTDFQPGAEVEDLNSSTGVIDEDAVQSRVRLVLPGVVFMLRDVFPNYMFWRYVDEGDREIIALSCMQMIHQLLNLNFSNESSADASRPICVLYRACLYSLLFLDAGAALLRIVGSGMAVIT